MSKFLITPHHWLTAHVKQLLSLRATCRLQKILIIYSRINIHHKKNTTLTIKSCIESLRLELISHLKYTIILLAPNTVILQLKISQAAQ